MASRLYHDVIDLIAFGRSHFDLHQWKDDPARRLGAAHREQRHEWYKAFGEDWDWNDPFPESLKRAIEHAGAEGGDSGAERFMSWASHDYLDRAWDTLSPPHRLYLEGLFIWILQHPEVLLKKFGVDVLNDRVARTIAGVGVWESARGLRDEYKRLCAYASEVVRRNPELEAALRRNGH